MAQKRMFDKSVVKRDDFLEMPDSSQVLYFQFSMDADDDGFVDNWKSIMRMCGKKEDDLKILIAKKFLIPFDSGLIVIRHWRINNYLRNDRYNETKYLDEKSLLNIDENGEYSLRSTIGIPVVDTDKSSIEENSIEYIPLKKDEKNSNKEEMFEDFWKSYPKKLDKQKSRKKFLSLNIDEKLFEIIMSKLEDFKSSPNWKKDNGQFIPYASTWLNNARWEDEMEKVENIDERFEKLKKEGKI